MFRVLCLGVFSCLACLKTHVFVLYRLKTILSLNIPRYSIVVYTFLILYIYYDTIILLFGVPVGVCINAVSLFCIALIWLKKFVLIFKK